MKNKHRVKNPWSIALFAIVFVICGACNPPTHKDVPLKDFEDDQDKKDKFPTIIHQTEGVGTLSTNSLSPLGRPVGVSCNVCHNPSLKNSIVVAKKDSDEKPFHQQVRDVREKHGNLTCAQCHNHGKQEQGSVHLADGSPVEYPAVVYLCGQCHGPQIRDYKNGTHGGASGYWNLEKGPKVRNHCLDCHNPHAPAYPKVIPVAPPKDRYLPHPDEKASSVVISKESEEYGQ